MKKRFLTASLATMMVLSLAACGGGKAADTTTAPAATEAPADTKAEDKAEETKAEETKAEAEAAGEKAPEDYKGTVVVYSPHDADPLNAGVNLFTPVDSHHRSAAAVRSGSCRAGWTAPQTG